MTDEHKILQGVRTEYTKYKHMNCYKIVREFVQNFLNTGYCFTTY